VNYAASKGALDTFPPGLAKEVAAEGIRVNAVRPGLIHTDIHASGGELGRVDRLAATVPMGRGDPLAAGRGGRLRDGRPSGRERRALSGLFFRPCSG